MSAVFVQPSHAFSHHVTYIILGACGVTTQLECSVGQMAPRAYGLAIAQVVNVIQESRFKELNVIMVVRLFGKTAGQIIRDYALRPYRIVFEWQARSLH